MDEQIKDTIQNWFTDESLKGKASIAKLYTEIRIVLDNELYSWLESEDEKNAE